LKVVRMLFSTDPNPALLKSTVNLLLAVRIPRTPVVMCGLRAA
jgi:hypothetical protein